MVDAESVSDFKKKYLDLKIKWPLEFVNWLETNKGRTRSLVASLEKCMLKPVRTAAGLGNPPNKWVSNLCESLNNVIKEEIDNNSVDLVTFLEKIK